MHLVWDNQLRQSLSATCRCQMVLADKVLFAILCYWEALGILICRSKLFDMQLDDVSVNLHVYYSVMCNDVHTY